MSKGFFYARIAPYTYYMNTPEYIVILFYVFADIADPKALAEAHKAIASKLGMTGRVLIAEEGVNATLEGTREAVDAYVAFLKQDPLFAAVKVKESAGTGSAFPRLVVKVRKEIVTLGVGRFDVAKETAKELPAGELQKWYDEDKDFVVLDLRNDYEIASGKFDKTIDPGLANFRDLPAKLSELSHLKDKKIVTVCTGGIRCEKATCLLTREGFSDVYQLKDGIHTYMEEFPASRFKGSLFVFDNRMTTTVIPLEEREIIGRCILCDVPTEEYYSDDSTRPSKKVLCCTECYDMNTDRFRARA